MRSLRSWLIASHLIPIFVIIPVIGFTIFSLLNSQLVINSVSEDLTDQAALIAEVANTQPGVWQDQSVANNYLLAISRVQQWDIMILDVEGNLLATSNPRYDTEVGQYVSDIPQMSRLQSGQQAVFLGVSNRTQTHVADVAVPATNAQNQVVGIVRVTSELDTLTQDFAELRRIVVLVVGFALIVGLGLSLVLALAIERPLRNLTTALQGIGERETAIVLPEEGPQEIRVLARTFNLLTERLQRLEETRRRLLANLVHELGRPLGAMRAAVHALQSGASDEPELRTDLLSGMNDEISRLEPLLDDLSQLHHQVLGPTDLKLQTIELKPWLEGLLPTWREAALAKGLHWQASVADDLPACRIDEARLAQAVGNLLSNAVKYTPAGGAIGLDTGQNETSVWLRIRDSGPGISPTDRARIFEAFYRGQQTHRFPQGLGLGLTIARELVEAHGGRLNLDSREGVGSAFTITLRK